MGAGEGLSLCPRPHWKHRLRKVRERRELGDTARAPPKPQRDPDRCPHLPASSQAACFSLGPPLLSCALDRPEPHPGHAQIRGQSQGSAQGAGPIHPHRGTSIPGWPFRGTVTLSSLRPWLGRASQIQLLRDPGCDFKRRVQTAQSQGLTHLQPGTCPRAPPGQEDSEQVSGLWGLRLSPAPSHGHQRPQLELGVEVSFSLRPADAPTPGCMCGVCASAGRFR